MRSNNLVNEDEIMDLIGKRSTNISIAEISKVGNKILYFGIFCFILGMVIKKFYEFHSITTFGILLLIMVGVIVFISTTIARVISGERYNRASRYIFRSQETKDSVREYLISYLQARAYGHIDRKRKGQASVCIIGEIGNHNTVDFLLQFFREGNHPPSIRLCILLALRERKDDRLGPLFIEALVDEDVDVQKLAIAVLTEMKEPRAIEPLTRLANDKKQDAKVQLAAALAVNDIKKQISPSS